jgi:hypothetical protein
MISDAGEKPGIETTGSEPTATAPDHQRAGKSSMAIYATQTGGKEYAKAPAGNHRAVCIGVYDVGTQESPEYGPKRKVLIQWELSDEPMEDGRPFSVSRQYTLSLHEKSTLRPLVGAWRGRPLTDAEAARFDVASLLGKACLVGVAHGERNGKTFAEVTTVGSLPKGMSPPVPANPLRTYSLEDGDEYPEGMPEWIIRRVGESLERRGTAPAAAPAARQPVPAQQPRPAGPQGFGERPAQRPKQAAPAADFAVPGGGDEADEMDYMAGAPF